MTEREKLIELLQVPIYPHEAKSPAEVVSDYLIDNGVRLESKQVISDESKRWISVTERMPDNFISVLGYMTDAGEFPPVRECYTVGNAFFFPALSDVHPVSHWMPMPEPPKKERRTDGQENHN